MLCNGFLWPGNRKKERARTTGTSVLTMERKHIFRMCYFCASTDREKHELHGWHSAFALDKLTTSGAVHANKIACSEDVFSSLRQYTKEVHFTRVSLENRTGTSPEGISSGLVLHLIHPT